ncbi:hypothetical protein Tco_1448633 [Tanacetum coccineum]
MATYLEIIDEVIIKTKSNIALFEVSSRISSHLISDHYMEPTEFEIQEMVNIWVSGEAYCLITVPNDHQLNGEVEILIVVTTNTTTDTQKESIPLPKEVSPFCKQLISARYGIDSNVRRRLTPSAMLQRPSMWDHDMLRTKVSRRKFVPELGALIHEKNSDPTQFIDLKDIGVVLQQRCWCGVVGRSVEADYGIVVVRMAQWIRDGRGCDIDMDYKRP